MEYTASTTPQLNSTVAVEKSESRDLENGPSKYAQTFCLFERYFQMALELSV
jgi:hypothetical protein